LKQTIDIQQADIRDILEIQQLAHEIWHKCYPGIITVGQIGYMLQRDYGLETLKSEITEGEIRFEQLLVEGKIIGFASHGPTESPKEIKIHKLYIHPYHQRKGHGSCLMDHIAKKCFTEGTETLVLAVNKRNTPAINSYIKNGFRQREAVIVEIGGGYIMDDYILEKSLFTADT
jgi:ribosomal protein S18 acetylase RimI-like enzyme